VIPQIKKIVDLDDPATWPPGVHEWIERWGERACAGTGLSAELITAEDEFRELLVGSRLLAYHCTRLLDHEEDLIWRDGLRPVSHEQMLERIRQAWEHGYLTASQRDGLTATTRAAVLETVQARGRGVFLSIGRAVFTEYPELCSEWLSIWGGPTLYESAGALFPGERQDLLKSLGPATIVVAELEFLNDRFWRREWFSLMFSRAALGLAFGGSEVCYSPFVPAKDVAAMWQPGNDEYDRYPELPQG
jgi:hypothetical protein